MDHKEQHHEHHRHERELRKKEKHQYDEKQFKKSLPLRSVWFWFAGAALVILSMAIYSFLIRPAAE